MENEIRHEDLYPDYVVPQNVPPNEYPYIIVGHYLPDGHWRVFEYMWKTRENAVEFAKSKGVKWQMTVYCLKSR